MRFALRLVLALSAVVVGCTAPPVKAPSPALQVTVVAAVAAPADSPTPADLPTPALDREFVPVTLPEGVGSLTSMSGRGASELWILGDEGALLHFEGERLVKSYLPEPCFRQAAF